MSTATERMAALAFGKYLTARGWVKQSTVPDGVHKADLSVVTKVGLEVPSLVKRLVAVYVSGDFRLVYIKIEGEGVWAKKTDKAIADIPGIAADSLKAEEVGAEIQRDLTWVVVGVGAVVVAAVGFILWKRK